VNALLAAWILCGAPGYAGAADCGTLNDPDTTLAVMSCVSDPGNDPDFCGFRPTLDACDAGDDAACAAVDSLLDAHYYGYELDREPRS
jgi:hypothetical protein